jgi:hypothetical protein
MVVSVRGQLGAVVLAVVLILLILIFAGGAGPARAAAADGPSVRMGNGLGDAVTIRSSDVLTPTV